MTTTAGELRRTIKHPDSGDVDGGVPAHHVVSVPGLVRRTHALLQARVPLVLLLDLAEPYGPDSVDRFTAEGGDTTWIEPAADR